MKALLDAERRERRQNKFLYFAPQEWQRKVIQKTAIFQEVSSFKANRVGGSIVANFMNVTWSTGMYDVERHEYGNDKPWKWDGRRFPGPTRGIIVVPEKVQARGAMQKILIGDSRETIGEGPIDKHFPLLPKDSINQIFWSKEIAGLVDYIQVKYRDTSDFSYIFFRSQQQSPTSVMGEEFHYVIFDEFPGEEGWYSQMVTRIQSVDGLIYVSATPEKEICTPKVMKIANRFLRDKPETQSGIPLTSFDYIHLQQAEHFTKEQKERISASYPESERPYRETGHFIFGSGFIYTTPDELLKITRDKLPDLRNCRHICGLDWGRMDWGAMVWLAFYGEDCFLWDIEKLKCSPYEAARFYHMRCQSLGMDIPLSWGWDVAGHFGGGEASVKELLEGEGVNVLPERAHNAFANDSSNAVWPGIQQIQKLMEEHRFHAILDVKTMAWWEEKRTYFIDENSKIPKKSDMRFDLLDATRYGVIMEPYAEYWGRSFSNRHGRNRENAVAMTLNTDRWNPLARSQ